MSKLKTTKPIREKLQENGIPFQMMIRGRREEIYVPETDMTYTHMDKFGGMKHMYVFGHVSSRAKKALEVTGGDMKFDIVRKPVFTHINKFWGENDGLFLGKDHDIFQIDITSAYWRIAHSLGLIRDDIYEKFYGIQGEGKVIRNMSIGALAAKNYYYSFDGEKLKFIDCQRSPTEKCYWKVASVCDELIRINKSELGEKYLFSWVDCFFVVGKEVSKKICERLIDSGFDYKITKIREICKYRGKFLVYDYNSPKPKVYTFPKPKHKKIMEEIRQSRKKI